MKIRTAIIQKIVEINEALIFYPKLYKFYRSVLPLDTIKKPIILDVGSNKGQSIDFFLKVNSQSQIFGFEPNRYLFQKLKEKYKRETNIVINNWGVSSKNGRLIFQENIMNETSTFEDLNYESLYLKKKARILGVEAKDLIVASYEVEVVTLLTFLHKHQGLFIDVLKIDVEGHEYDCLIGLFENEKLIYPIRFIQIESHNDDMYLNKEKAQKISEILRGNGFNEVAKIKHGFGDFYEIIYENTRL